MSNLENVVKTAEYKKYESTKDGYVEISKSVFSDIKGLVGNHKVTNMSFKINTYTKENDPLCITVLTVIVSDDEWYTSDDFMHTYNNTSFAVKDVERCIRDMAAYYKKEILKIS